MRPAWPHVKDRPKPSARDARRACLTCRASPGTAQGVFNVSVPATPTSRGDLKLACLLWCCSPASRTTHCTGRGSRAARSVTTSSLTGKPQATSPSRRFAHVSYPHPPTTEPQEGSMRREQAELCRQPRMTPGRLSMTRSPSPLDSRSRLASGKQTVDLLVGNKLYLNQGFVLTVEATRVRVPDGSGHRILMFGSWRAAKRCLG